MDKDTNNGKTNPVKSVIRLIIFLGLGIFFIWLSLKNLTREDIRMILDSMSLINTPFNWLMLCCAGAFALFADVARAQRAKLLLEPLGYNVSNIMCFYSVMVCYLANLALPRLGEVLRCSFLQRFENVPFQKSLGTVVTERAVDILCWGVMLLIVIGLNTSLLNDLVINQETQTTLGAWMEQKGLSVLSNYFIFALLAFFIIIGFIIYLTRRWWQKVSWMMKVRNIIAGIWQGFISIKNLPKPSRYILWNTLMWVSYFAGTYFCFLALPFLRPVGPGAAFTLLILSTIAFMISQGGLGSYPLFAAGILVMYNIPYTQGLAAGWIGWILQTVIVLVFGLISLLLASFYSKKNKPTTPTTQS